VDIVAIADTSARSAFITFSQSPEIFMFMSRIMV
jgi:hypothetical protein